MIETLLQRLDDLEYAVADQKRRQANIVRTGVVKTFDPADNGSVVVDLASADDTTPFLTHSIPLFTHAGAGKDWRPFAAGQQVTLICADGDLANAVAIPGGFHDKNPAPSKSADEDIVGARGSVLVRTNTTTASLEADSSTNLKAIQGGWTLASVQGTAQFVIFDGSNYWQINPAALLPASAPPSSSS